MLHQAAHVMRLQRVPAAAAAAGGATIHRLGQRLNQGGGQGAAQPIYQPLLRGGHQRCPCGLAQQRLQARQLLLGGNLRPLRLLRRARLLLWRQLQG